MSAEPLTFAGLRKIAPSFPPSPTEVDRRLNAAAANCSAAMALVERTEARLRGAA